MVLQHASRLSHQAPAIQRLDVNRILGISTTLALNVLALALLLTPMTLPAPPAQPDRRPELQVVPIVPVVPVTRTPPPLLPVTRPTTRTATPRPEAPAPVVATPVEMATGTLADPAPLAPVADAAVAPATDAAGPAIGLQLQYDSAPPPQYPRIALQRGLEGVVLLRVVVGVDGRPVEVGIERSSGHELLDREATRHVLRRWRFQPAIRDGQPVQAIGIVPIAFHLGRQ